MMDDGCVCVCDSKLFYSCQQSRHCWFYLQVLLGGHGEQFLAFLFITTGNMIDKGFHFSQMILHAHAHAVVVRIRMRRIAAVEARVHGRAHAQRGQQVAGRSTSGHDTGRTGPAAGQSFRGSCWCRLFEAAAGTLGQRRDRGIAVATPVAGRAGATSATAAGRGGGSLGVFNGRGRRGGVGEESHALWLYGVSFCGGCALWKGKTK